MPSVDLNSDLGEGFGIYRCGDDDAMLSIVTSANVACGLHAGDPEVMARTFAVARERGVAVGVASALPVSIERIAKWAKGAEGRGVLLVPISGVAKQRRPDEAGRVTEVR